SFGREAAALPPARDPEPAIGLLADQKTDDPCHRLWFDLRSHRPVPAFAAGRLRFDHRAVPRHRAVGRIWPRHLRGQVADDLPLRELALDLVEIPFLDGPKDQLPCFED